jgi:hypothetical protein
MAQLSTPTVDKPKKKDVITFFEGSNQFLRIPVTLPINIGNFILLKLKEQYAYRSTKEILWAESYVDGISTRYVLDDKNQNTLIRK